MYGLPKDFDEAAFVGQELVQVSFSVNTIHFVFDGKASLTLLSTFIYSPSLNDAVHRETVPVSSSGLMELIGNKVKSARATSDGQLTLVFENGGSLTCVDDSIEYESYYICIGDKEIIV